MGVSQHPWQFWVQSTIYHLVSLLQHYSLLHRWFLKEFPSCSSSSANRKLQNVSTSVVQPWKNTDFRATGLKVSTGFASTVAAFATIWNWSRTGYITAQTHQLIWLFPLSLECIRSKGFRVSLIFIKPRLLRTANELISLSVFKIWRGFAFKKIAGKVRSAHLRAIETYQASLLSNQRKTRKRNS